MNQGCDSQGPAGHACSRPSPLLPRLLHHLPASQCGRFHALSDFDGPQRSCRSQLAYHAARRRELRKRRAAAAPASDSMTLSIDSGSREQACRQHQEAEPGHSCSSGEAGGPSSPFPLTTRPVVPATGKAPVQPQQPQQRQAGADWSQLSFLASAATSRDAVQAPKPAVDDSSQLLQLQHSMLSSATHDVSLGSLILQHQPSGVMAAAAPVAATSALPLATQPRVPPMRADGLMEPQSSGRVSEDSPFPSWGCKRRRLVPSQPAAAAQPAGTPGSPRGVAALAATLLASPPVLKPTPRLPVPVHQRQQPQQLSVPAAVAALAGLGPAQLQGLSPATAAALVQLEIEKRRCAASLRRTFLQQLQAVVQPKAAAPSPLAVSQVVCPAPLPATSPFAALATATPATAPLGRLLGADAPAPRTSAQPALLPQQTAALLSCLASCLRQ